MPFSPTLPRFTWIREESQWEGKMSRVSKMELRTMLFLFSDGKKRITLKQNLELS